MLELPTLNAVEQRVLGCLVEKELTTPEYYPLSLNALINACNQKSSRDPVMEVGEGEVVSALDRLRHLGMARIAAGGGRVDKFSHSLEAKLSLHPGELAVMAVLLLRGAQTVGELRGRTSRLYEFEDLTAVEEVLEELADREPPLVSQLARQPGRKEVRHVHLLGEVTERPAPVADLTPATESGPSAMERLQSVEQELEQLRSEFAALQAEFASFRQQFE